MTKTFYLTGQNNFGNRGCEALVRSTVGAVRNVIPAARFLVPSLAPALDAAQWPEHAACGVELVPAPRVPWRISKWGGLCRRAPPLARLPWPQLSASSEDGRCIARVDMVLSIGGDNYSLDYGVASLAYFVAVADLARRMSKPVALWGASVGPFSAMPPVERHITAHLRALNFISVRESASIDYLQSIGVAANVVPVVDTAFLLVPQSVDLSAFLPSLPGKGVVGLNMSWWIQHVRHKARISGDLLEETAAFVARVLLETEMSVLLIPHVAPLDGDPVNSDDISNQQLQAQIKLRCPAASERLGVVPPGLNAAQLKFVISRCRFLLAARTHATIAAFSTSVPTISIAYSVKARGINRDLFGHERYILDSREVDADSLWKALSVLMADELQVIEQYRVRLGNWKTLAAAGVLRLRQELG